MAKPPNFFIVGAPKCGTTALSEYLGTHPEIHMSTPKEPHYFSTDLPTRRLYSTWDDYLSSCFSGTHPGHKAVGEASVFYLFSAEAIPNILARDPDARFIAMVRNPVEMVLSYYYQLRYNCEEDASTFEQAWMLQEERREGRLVPATLGESRLLLYRDVCSVGTQVETLLGLADRDRIEVVLFDDFRRETRIVYRRILEFLDVTEDGRKAFPVFNERKDNAVRFLARMVNKPPARLHRTLANVYRIAGIRRTGLTAWINRLNQRRVTRSAMQPGTRRLLSDAFDEEIAKIENILGRDLAHWRTLT